MLTYTRRMKLIDNHKKGVTKEIILQKLKHSESTYYRIIKDKANFEQGFWEKYINEFRKKKACRFWARIHHNYF